MARFESRERSVTARTDWMEGESLPDTIYHPTFHIQLFSTRTSDDNLLERLGDGTRNRQLFQTVNVSTPALLRGTTNTSC